MIALPARSSRPSRRAGGCPACRLSLILGGLAAAAWVATAESAVAGDPEPAEAAEWIWSGEADRDGTASIVLRQSFSIGDEVDQAELRVAGDFTALRVTINGRSAAILDPYDPPAQLDVSRLMTQGDNAIEIEAAGVAGPSAAAAAVVWKTATDDSGGTLLSDTSWQSDSGPVIALGSTRGEGRLRSPMPDVTPFAEYNQWKEALPAVSSASAGGSRAAEAGPQLSPLPPGFEISKIRDAAEGEDSWVALTFDPQGRLIIAKERTGLLRMTLSEQGDRVESVEEVNDSLAECRGLIWYDGALYAHANRDKVLVRLRDTTGDDWFDEVTPLLSTEAGTGHGRNGFAVAPDGSLHGIVGDDVLVPDDSPRMARPEAEAPRELGHWVKLAVPRTDESGGDSAKNSPAVWTAMNRGLRNPYGIDFNPDGEPFTYDADNEGDVGLPFYRPTRINHLVSGANYGWQQTRNNTRSLPVYAPDSLPTTLDLGRGSPTGVTFGTRSNFPAPWRDALFVLDWAYGRIIAVTLVPQGASYVGAATVFLEGRPLNVTDVTFDDSGAMWFVTGGRRTQASLYRVRYVGGNHVAGDDVKATLQSEARSAFSAKARQVRKELERFHGREVDGAVEQIWPHLGDPDPWLRGAARVALEWQPVEQWRDRAAAEAFDLRGLTARLALARAGDEDDAASLIDELLRFDARGLTRSEKLIVLRIHELCGPPTKDADCRAAADGLLALAADSADDTAPREPIYRETANHLVALGAAQAVSFALERMASADNQLDRLHYVEVLAEAEAGWTPPQRKAYFTALAYAKKFSYGDRFMPPFFEAIERNALARVSDAEEREAMQAILDGAAESDASEADQVAEPRPLVRRWTVEELSDGASGDTSPGRGRELFAAASCAKCHVCGTVGRPVGPDLTTVAHRFSRRDLLESIIEPSKVIAETYRNVIVIRDDGTTVTGRIVQNDFRQSKLILATGDSAADLVEVPKSSIESWSESPVSPMPDGLLDTLTRDEIEDLLAFLISGGGAVSENGFNESSASGTGSSR